MENDQAGSPREKRNVFLRIVFSVLWLILIILTINMLLGGIVGGMAGAETANFGAGRAAGRNASLEFFQNYGRYVFIGELIIWIVLSVSGKLPGTAKYKKVKA